ncbi:MAG: HPr family phosphocarrier protein [Rhodocyclaceae bacterium]|nr:HPr family phosphocarrier protein [Rhodocyclaceae bacterium]
MVKRDIEIVNRLGLHARASAKVTQTAARFSSDVFMTRNGRRINAKSIMGVMMLAAPKGSLVTLEINGADEEDAMATLSKLIADRFGEPD